MFESFLLNRHLNAWVAQLLGSNVTVFTLHRARGSHGLSGTDKPLLQRFLTLLVKHGVQFVSIDELIEGKLEFDPAENYVCFTLDDGYSDQALELIPTLLEYETKPTLFIIHDLIEKGELPWDARISISVKASKMENIDISDLDIGIESIDTHTDRRQLRRALSKHAKQLSYAEREQFVSAVEQLLSTPSERAEVAQGAFAPITWSDICELESMGLRIGTHTCSHQPLSTLDDEQIKSEMEFAIIQLRQHLKAPSKVLCYPVGMASDYDNRCIRIAKQLGFSGAVTAVPRYASMGNILRNPFETPRFSFPRNLGNALRYVSWLEKLRPSNRA